MIFTFLMSIVFIAEIIIAFTIIFNLIKFDKFLTDTNILLEKAKPEIRSICELYTGISAQIVEFSQIGVDKFKAAKERFILKQLESLMSAILFWSINIKILKKFRKNKIIKTALKGLTLLQSVV